MTDAQKLRLLINDQDSSEFSDDQLQAFLDVHDGSLFLAAASACDALVSKYSRIPVTQVSIGGFQTTSGRTQMRYLETMAERWRQLEYDTPAFAIAQENLSDFNQLIMIRNYILKTEMP